VYIRKDVADRLIKLGVPDDSGSLGHVVSQLAEMSISLGQAYLPDVSDMAACRSPFTTASMNSTDTLSLLKLLAVLGATESIRLCSIPSSRTQRQHAESLICKT